MNKTECKKPELITIIQNYYLNPLKSTVVTLGRIKIKIKQNVNTNFMSGTKIYKSLSVSEQLIIFVLKL